LIRKGTSEILSWTHGDPLGSEKLAEEERIGVDAEADSLSDETNEDRPSHRPALQFALCSFGNGTASTKKRARFGSE
jgi:hypothetical protein